MFICFEFSLMLFFSTKENQCVFGVLTALQQRKSTYTKMFRETKVSHTTLQLVLEKMQTSGLIAKYDIGHKKVDYEITKKGTQCLVLLHELRKLLF